MKIHTFDTTLRDGTQGGGMSLSVDDKLRIARRLDDLRFDDLGHAVVLPALLKTGIDQRAPGTSRITVSDGKARPAQQRVPCAPSAVGPHPLDAASDVEGRKTQSK